MSFQLESKQEAGSKQAARDIGRMRYKAADGTHGKVQPQAVGQRVLYAQLLNLGRIPELAEASQPAAKRRKLEAAPADSPVSSQEKGSAEEGRPAEAAGGSNAQARRDAGDDAASSSAEEEAAAAGKRLVNDKEKKLQKKRDLAATEACALLSGKEEWQGILETEQIGARSFGRLKVAAAAYCRAFGKRRYNTIKGRSFWRCSACPRVFQSRSMAGKHRCDGQQRAQAAPRPARQRSAAASELLPGGIQLNVHLPAEVCC